MPKCGCAGTGCNCLIVPGENIQTGGTGSLADPYVISQNIPQVTIDYSGGDLDLRELRGRSSVYVRVLAGSLPASAWLLPQGMFDMVMTVHNVSGGVSDIKTPGEIVPAPITSGLTNQYARTFRMAAIPGGMVHASNSQISLIS